MNIRVLKGYEITDYILEEYKEKYPELNDFINDYYSKDSEVQNEDMETEGLGTIGNSISFEQLQKLQEFKKECPENGRELAENLPDVYNVVIDKSEEREYQTSLHTQEVYDKIVDTINEEEYQDFYNFHHTEYEKISINAGQKNEVRFDFKLVPLTKECTQEQMESTEYKEVEQKLKVLKEFDPQLGNANMTIEFREASDKYDESFRIVIQDDNLGAIQISEKTLEKRIDLCKENNLEEVNEMLSVEETVSVNENEQEDFGNSPEYNPEAEDLTNDDIDNLVNQHQESQSNEEMSTDEPSLEGSSDETEATKTSELDENISELEDDIGLA